MTSTNEMRRKLFLWKPRSVEQLRSNGDLVDKRMKIVASLLALEALLMVVFADNVDLICNHLAYENISDDDKATVTTDINNFLEGRQSIDIKCDKKFEAFDIKSLVVTKAENNLIFYMESRLETRQASKRFSLEIKLNIPFKSSDSESRAITVMQYSISGLQKVKVKVSITDPEDRSYLSQVLSPEKRTTMVSVDYPIALTAKGVAFDVNIINIEGDATSDVSVSVYVALCSKLGESFLEFEGCRTVLQGENIQCRCPPSKYYSVLLTCIIMIVFMISCFFCFIFCFIRSISNRMTVPPAHELNMSCSHKKAKHQYLLTFRIGCPSANFNMNATHVHFELMDENRASSADGRIKSQYLSFDEVSEIRYVINRMTPLKQEKNMATISFNLVDGDPDSEIFFYGASLFSPEIKSTVYFPVNKYITSEKTTCVLVVEFPGQLEAKAKESPNLPLPQLTVIDVFVFIFFMVNLMALFCSVSVQKFASFDHQLNFWEALICTLIAIVIALPIECLLILSYRHLVKQEEGRHRLVLGQIQSKWTFVQMLVLALLLILGMGITAVVSMSAEDLSTRNVVYWLASTVNASVVVLSLWGLCSASRAYYNLRNRYAPKTSLDQPLALGEKEAPLGPTSSTSSLANDQDKGNFGSKQDLSGLPEDEDSSDSETSMGGFFGQSRVKRQQQPIKVKSTVSPVSPPANS